MRRTKPALGLLSVGVAVLIGFHVRSPFSEPVEHPPFRAASPESAPRASSSVPFRVQDALSLSQAQVAPLDASLAIVRAKAALASLHAARLPMGHTWGKPRAFVNEAGAQVVFQQEDFRGTPIVPYGAATLRLDREGRLKAHDFDSVPSPRVVNQRLLSESQGRGSLNLGDSVASSRPVLWMPYRLGAAGRSPEAYEAYEYVTEDGYQVVVDAESGKILSRRDRRQF